MDLNLGQFMSDAFDVMYKNGNIGQAADCILKLIGRVFKADAAYIAETSDSGDLIERVYEWKRGSGPRSSVLSGIMGSREATWVSAAVSSPNAVIRGMRSTRLLFTYRVSFLCLCRNQNRKNAWDRIKDSWKVP